MRTVTLTEPYAVDWNGVFTRLPAGLPLALEEDFAGGLIALGKAAAAPLDNPVQTYTGLHWPEKVVKAETGALVVPDLRQG